MSRTYFHRSKISLHDLWGFIPGFLDENDPRPAREQINANYRHGGGWQPMPNFTRTANGALLYPGDPPFPVLSTMYFRDEYIHMHECSIVCIVQKDGTWEAARLD